MTLKERSPAARSRYRTENGKLCIDVSLKNLRQIFDARDPAPFIDRDLDDDAVDYIMSAAEEFSIRTPLKLVLYYPPGGSGDLSPEEVRDAIHSYFGYQYDLLGKKLSRILKQGRGYALVGIAFLVTCLLLAGRASTIENQTIARAVSEGLTITGWVALWRPVQLFLYDWVPMFEKRRYFWKLAGLEIDVKAHADVETPG